jgi:hypothetical protein
MNENVNEVSVETQDTETVETERTYSQEEVMKLIQSETDKRVTQALATQAKKYEKKLSLSQLDGDERVKAEKDNRIAELEEQLAAFTVERNRSEIKSVLSSRGLSAEFADILLINDDIETSQQNIEKLDKLFKQAVKAEVEKRLIGNTPKGNGGVKKFTKENKKDMTIQELQQLKKTNPEEYFALYN